MWIFLQGIVDGSLKNLNCICDHCLLNTWFVRNFCYLILSTFFFCACSTHPEGTSYLMTVTGAITPSQMGKALSHEHVVTDFAGAEKVTLPQYGQEDAIKTILPHLKALKERGISTLVECTPKYIGRDVQLLNKLSELSGVLIITNTGYYAAVDKKFLPAHVYSESAETLAERWMKEWLDGIEETGIRPGFIKLGVGAGPIDSIEAKLLRAAVMVSTQSGLTIAMHSGDGAAAQSEYQILIDEGGQPQKMIWVHAQNGTDEERITLAKKGVWISLDGISETRLPEYLTMVQSMKEAHLLSRLMISHDDGWEVKLNQGQAALIPFENGNSQPYETIFNQFIQAMYQNDFTEEEINELLVENPQKAYSISQ